MTVFRIERLKYLETTLLGIGASLSEGFRWNSLHSRMVYTAESRSLATLEVAVHLDISEDLPSDRIYVEIEIPDHLGVQELQPAYLPADWDAIPPGNATKRIGDEFLTRMETAVLKVPSSIVPGEFNYLLNPLHPDFPGIVVARSYPMHFDRRLLKIRT
jgi:RES domain-containing protein